MQEDPEIQQALAVHIRAAGRPGGESVRLTRDLVRRCWPGGPQDRTESVARGWLRMWGPMRVVVEVPTCTCEHGRCTICN